MSRAYLHVRRKKEEELAKDENIVYELKVSKTRPQLDGTVKDAAWEYRDMGLWIKRSSTRQSDENKYVTGVDVLFGPDAADPRSNWRILDHSLEATTTGENPQPHLTVRHGPAGTFERPKPRIRKDGKFKIMQAADLHLATGLGKCREAIPNSYNDGPCEADPRTLEFVEKMIEDEKPDLVILSGDQVNGDTAPDAQTAIYKYSALFAKHELPWAGIFGNHDDEGNLNREQSMEIMDGLPFSLSRAGPPDVDGVGNYYFEILGRGAEHNPALTVYMLDTHSYSPNEKKYHGYDWLKPSQITWFRDTAQSLKKKNEKYTHIHMNLAFIHIPLPEYNNPELEFVGNWTEAPTAPAYNTNFKDALVDENVVMVSCGHDHVNDYCIPGLDKEGKSALWMCYGGGSGFGGYGGYYGYTRRIRFFDIDMNEARISTWKRLEHGETELRIDEQIIVDAGRAVTGMHLSG